MTRVLVVVRESGKLKPDYSLHFDLPEVPKIGSYISITRPDTEPWTEDVVVRQVWWRLHHPETRAGVSSEDVKVGAVTEIVVECDPAQGPHASDRWRKDIEASGIAVEKFELERFAVRQSDLRTKA